MYSNFRVGIARGKMLDLLSAFHCEIYLPMRRLGAAFPVQSLPPTSPSHIGPSAHGPPPVNSDATLATAGSPAADCRGPRRSSGRCRSPASRGSRRWTPPEREGRGDRRAGRQRVHASVFSTSIRRVRVVTTCALIPDTAWIPQPLTIGSFPIARSFNIDRSRTTGGIQP